MPPLSKKLNCRGCGSRQHKTACCPNLPCPCCGERHSRGILDCPIQLVAMTNAAARGAVAAAAVPASAAAAAAVVSVAAAAKRAERVNAAAAARVAGKMAAAAKRQHEMAKFRQVEASCLQPQRQWYTKHNWEVKVVWSCFKCGGTIKFCFCPPPI